MEGIIFKVHIKGFSRHKMFWSGMLFNEGRLVRIVLPLKYKAQAIRHLKKDISEKIIFTKNGYSSEVNAVRGYFEGKKSGLPFKVEINNTNKFTDKVLKAVKNIPYGKVASYAEIAKKAGSPRAIRAVGSVMARNKMPLVIPCHRVVQKGGEIGGFSAGFAPKLKKIMLDIEQGAVK